MEMCILRYGCWKYKNFECDAKPKSFCETLLNKTPEEIEFVKQQLIRAGIFKGDEL